MLKIALIGHDTRNPNLGVGALTVSDITIIREAANKIGVNAQITVLIGKGHAPRCITGTDVVEHSVRPLRKPWDFYKAIKQNDIVIDISGGDSFSDIYGARRIFQILLQKYLVHFAQRPLVMAPQTVGPFKKHVWKRLSASSINRCAIVCTRDEKSTAFLREIGVDRKDIVEASDVALRLPYEQNKFSTETISPKVGINVSALLMKGGYSGKNEFGLKSNYPDLIRDLIKHFCDHDDGCELHLLGHVVPFERGGVEDDYQVCLDLGREFANVTVAPPFKTPSEAKSYISQMDFFAGARMHACIAAFSTGVPMVAMAYSRKFEGLFGTLGYNHTVDCTKDSELYIKNQIFSAYENRLALKNEITIALAEGKTKLQNYENALSMLFKENSRQMTSDVSYANKNLET